MKKITSLLTVLFIESSIAFGQAGTLDISFDGDGIVTTPIGIFYEDAYALCVQQDEKIIAAGYSNSSTNYFFDYDFALVRYNADGSLDPSFGIGGKVTTDFGSIGDFGLSAVLQPDGKIIVTGETYINGNYNDGFAVARYNEDGTLDNSFSTDGKVTVDFGSGDDVSFKVVVQPDGKILVAGYAFSGTQTMFALLRLDSTGIPDNTFGNSGKVMQAIGSYNDRAYDLALLPDGKIIAAGRSDNGTTYDFALVRFNSNGSIDNSFGTNGTVTTDIANADDYGNAMSLQPDGKIIVSGYTGDILSITKFAMIRYDSLGTIDNTFGSNGRVTTALTNHDESYAITLQPDQKILLAGRSYNGSNNDFGIARYDSNGSPDTSFDSDGNLTLPISNGHDEAFAMAMQQDGKILIAGRAEYSTDDFALIRIFSDVATEMINPEQSSEPPFIYPNPSSGVATLSYTLLQNQNIAIELYNLMGKRELVLVNGKQSAGEHTSQLNLKNLFPGMYMIRMVTEEGIFSKQLLVSGE
ncbi:MAG TPA: T9SS type A sorting domain-containing protein [Chitinophagales bacterium]|nr:T9SS type A sorting domain-containing protein [Chitinophagales bacterium]